MKQPVYTILFPDAHVIFAFIQSLVPHLRTVDFLRGNLFTPANSSEENAGFKSGSADVTVV